jgi:hypothetical protein
MNPTFPNAGQDPRLTEKLLTANSQRRKLSIDQHDQLRRELLGGLVDERDFDDIDHAVDDVLADPVLDRLPAYRKGSDADRLTSLLDSLERRDG